MTAVQAALTTSAGGVATLSLPPHPSAAQQQHLEVTGAGAATATVVLTSEDVEKDKLDKGTCTTERCGENQVHCQVSVNYCHVLAASRYSFIAASIRRACIFGLPLAKYEAGARREIGLNFS